MGTFNDGDSGSSIRTKINTAIEKTEGTSAISTIDVDGGAIDGVTLGTNSAVTEAQVDNININGNTILSTNTNGDVIIDPNGTGNVKLGNFEFDADQTVGSGQDNYVLTYDHSSTSISLEAAAGGGGGALNHISTQTVTSSTASVTFSSVSGYDYYKIFFDGDLSTGGGQLRMTFFDGGTEVTTGYNTVLVRNGGSNTGTNVAHMFVTDFTGRSQIIAEISIGGDNSNPRIISSFSGRESGNYIVGVSSGIQTASVTTLNGFKIFPGTGTIDAAKISLYGVSQS